jgi:hypothetical protein
VKTLFILVWLIFYPGSEDPEYSSSAAILTQSQCEQLGSQLAAESEKRKDAGEITHYSGICIEVPNTIPGGI